MMQSVSVKEQLGMHHNCKSSRGKLKHDTMVVNEDWAGIVFLKFPKLGFFYNVTRTRHVGPKRSCRSAQSTSEKIVGGIGKFQEKQWSYRTGVRVLGGNDKTWARVCGQMLGTFQER